MKPATSATALAFLVALVFPGPAHAGNWTWPVSGEVITAYRNGGDPYAGGQHRGIDIAAPAGERVVAATAGTVTFAGVAGSSGLTVSVRTADGGFDVSYLHLADLAVREGDAVRAGGALGAVGTSGRRSADRPHLHFGVREAGERHAYLDPLDFLGDPPPPRGEPREPAPAPAPSEAPAEPRGAPPATAPAPAGAPSGGPATNPASQPSPVRTPGPGPLPVPSAGADPFARGPADRHAVATAAWAGPSRHGHLRARPLRSPNAGLRHGHTGQPSPAVGPGPVRAVVEAESRPTGRAPLTRAPRRDGGVDVGWLVACLGLLLSATVLGRAATSAPGRPRSRRDPAVLSRRITGGTTP